jgi:putative membrane protein
MFIRRLALTTAVVGVFLAPGTAATAAPSDQDAAYLRAAHQSNLAEIASGKLAQQKGASDQVKELGARWVADHTKLDAAVRDTAEALDVELPSAPNAEQRALAARYEAASGKDFDTLFIPTQMTSHMKTMRLGETELADGSDAQAKKVARDAAPVVAAHHDALEAAARDLGVPTGVNSGTGGQAADRVVNPSAVTLIGVGALLTVAAAFLLRRRRITR